MKLLVVSHSCASTVNLHLYAHLQTQTQWQVTVLRPSGWRNEYGNVLNEQSPESFPGQVVSLPVWRSGNIILHAYRKSLRRILRELKPDVIYVNHEPYAVATAQVYLANRMTLRRPIGFYSCQNILKKYPPPFSWAESMVLRQSSFFFPISAEVEAVFRRKGYDGPAAVLPLGTDPDVYYPRPEGQQLRREWGHDGNPVILGYVGRMVPEKGLATLLKALSTMRHLNWRLIVVGAGPMEAEFDRLTHELALAERVTRVGFVPHEQAPNYLSAFDVLVLPSETQPNWKEQFGRVIIEAMACGAAVVGSDSGEIPRLIADTGGGLVFQERQPDDLARQLGRLINDRTLRSELAAAGQKAVADRYSLPAIAKRFAETVVSGMKKSN